jgi:hypothetical protein
VQLILTAKIEFLSLAPSCCAALCQNAFGTGIPRFPAGPTRFSREMQLLKLCRQPAETIDILLVLVPFKFQYLSPIMLKFFVLALLVILVSALAKDNACTAFNNNCLGCIQSSPSTGYHCVFCPTDGKCRKNSVVKCVLNSVFIFIFCIAVCLYVYFNFSIFIFLCL